MQLPCIHPNGTSKNELLAALSNASLALDAAFVALKKTAPNGRDYYPLGPEAMRNAVAS